jgi:hypothetical protein
VRMLAQELHQLHDDGIAGRLTEYVERQSHLCE